MNFPKSFDPNKVEYSFMFHISSQVYGAESTYNMCYQGKLFFQNFRELKAQGFVRGILLGGFDLVNIGGREEGDYIGFNKFTCVEQVYFFIFFLITFYYFSFYFFTFR